MRTVFLSFSHQLNIGAMNLGISGIARQGSGYSNGHLGTKGTVKVERFKYRLIEDALDLSISIFDIEENYPAVISETYDPAVKGDTRSKVSLKLLGN